MVHGNGNYPETTLESKIRWEAVQISGIPGWEIIRIFFIVK